MNRLSITLDRESGRFWPGETLTGEVSWRLREPPDAAELRLFWYTVGKGDRDLDIVKTLPFPSPGMGEDHRFELTLPMTPYSFSGKLISVVWALELVLQPGDFVERVPFVLSPTGDEIHLADAQR